MNELKRNNIRIRQKNETATTPHSPSPATDTKVPLPKVTPIEFTKYRDGDKSRYMTYFFKL